jgi:hypothetical protein
MQVARRFGRANRARRKMEFRGGAEFPETAARLPFSSQKQGRLSQAGCAAGRFDGRSIMPSLRPPLPVATLYL